ncbi:hypothetical protein HOO65_070541 [Ceratocystis lukuohia]|uniref:Uncharacterized protein n=1 Tax=Ceratocystis lukuohia TaxID=2019550 RepID=A0ABR4MCT0_9PEZI
MQSWTVTFLLALAGTAIALPAVDVANTNGNIVARQLKNCRIEQGNICVCDGPSGLPEGPTLDQVIYFFFPYPEWFNSGSFTIVNVHHKRAPNPLPPTF